MRVDNSTGKGTSGMDKFSSKVHRVHMELGSKLSRPRALKGTCSRRAHSHIGVGLMEWCPGIYTCVGICGRVIMMHRDLWSYLYSRKGGA
jgi:hypothetical protein